MHYPFILTLILAFLFSPALGQAKRNTAPPKAGSREAKYELKSPAPKISLGATIEKYVSSYDINRDGTARETLEIQKRCTTNDCIELFSNFVHVYNADLQRLKVVDAYLVKADGKVVKITQNLITDKPTPQTEAAPGFSSLRQLEIKFTEWRMGDAAYFKLEGATTKPTLEGRYDALEVFSVLFNWKSIEINVTAPTGFEIFTEAVALDGGKLSDENGRSRWQFRKAGISSVDYEPLMTPLGISPRFALTTFRNAEELGSAFWEIVKKKAVVTPEIQTLADEITNGAKTQSEQASAIYEWVNRNIRYFLIVLDRGGWLPHDSQQILKNGYGDCKDYTVLIHALLKAKGIDSVPVLVRSELGNWFPAVPTMEYFNHAIVYIPSLKLFADATMPNTRLGLIPQTLVGKKAILGGEKPGVVEIPKDNPVDNQMISDVRYSFTENGNVKGHSRNTYVGRAEMLFRPMFADTRSGSDPNLIVKIMLAFFGIEGDGKIIKVGDPHRVGEPFSVEFETAVENYTTFTSKGKLPLPVGLNMMNMLGMEQFAASESRKTDLELGATRIRENITIDLPPSVRLVAAPPSVNVTTSVGSFRITPEMKDGRLHIIRELSITKDSIGPNDYPQFKELVGKLVDSHNVDIEYTADQSLLRAKSKERKKAGRTEPRSATDKMMEILGSLSGGAPLPAKEVRQLEAKVIANDGDEDSRRKLLRHYAHYDTKQTAAVKAAYLKHRLWMINNRPDVSDQEVLSWFRIDLPQTSLTTLKDAWLTAVEKTKTDAAVRLNAIEFLKFRFPAEAEKLIADGIALDPTNYKYPLLMTNLLSSEVTKDTSEEQKKVIAKKLLGPGRAALGLIKKERSSERDGDRRDLLQVLASAAVAADELDAAAAFATELILEFGHSVADYRYGEASHYGNITLGRVELRRGKIEKAKEYLLVAIRAPLRDQESSLLQLDFRLAKELYDKGVRAEIVEFLRLCLELNALKTDPKTYEDEIRAIKLWQTQIESGMKPSFDFQKP